MKNVTIKYAILGYLPFIMFLCVSWLAVFVDIKHIISVGYFKEDIQTFATFLTVAVLFAIIVFKILPSYKVIISDQGIKRFYTVSLFGLKFYEDKYGEAKWEKINCLDTFNIGWMWGLALHFSSNGKQRMVMINCMYSSKRDALKFIVSKLPNRKISEKAKRKLKKMNISVS